MTIYAESSAVLSWLFGEPRGADVQRTLAGAEFVVSSIVTLIECDRAFHRARHLGELSTERFAVVREELRRAASAWVVLQLTDEIVERARGNFPAEPIRSLDALHLASALTVSARIPDTTVLTLDERIRSCCRALGLAVIPAGED